MSLRFFGFLLSWPVFFVNVLAFFWFSGVLSFVFGGCPCVFLVFCCLGLCFWWMSLRFLGFLLSWLVFLVDVIAFSWFSAVVFACFFN